MCSNSCTSVVQKKRTECSEQSENVKACSQSAKSNAAYPDRGDAKA